MPKLLTSSGSFDLPSLELIGIPKNAKLIVDGHPDPGDLAIVQMKSDEAQIGFYYPETNAIKLDLPNGSITIPFAGQKIKLVSKVVGQYRRRTTLATMLVHRGKSLTFGDHVVIKDGSLVTHDGWPQRCNLAVVKIQNTNKFVIGYFDYNLNGVVLSKEERPTPIPWNEVDFVAKVWIINGVFISVR